MTDNWTNLDPGRGDNSSCAAAQQWTAAQVRVLDNALVIVTSILSELDDSWSGASADGFRARLQQFNARLTDAIEAMEGAGKAIAIYGDTVADIAVRAEIWKTCLTSARFAFESISRFPQASNNAQFRHDLELRAAAEIDSAVENLHSLAAERTVADNTVASQLASAVSAAWDDLDCVVPTFIDIPRDATNARVLELFNHFRLGDRQGEVLTEDDIFVQTLRQSDHLQSVRETVLSDLRSGILSEDTPLNYDRRISDNPWVLLRDLASIPTIATSGKLAQTLLSWQNMPETYLGSYNLKVSTGAPRPDGSVDVTYVISNYTSIDSFTRIPGTDGFHVPGPYELLNEQHRRTGEWSTHHQIIVWTETVFP